MLDSTYLQSIATKFGVTNAVPLLLQRQGVSDMLRTSDCCPTWGTDHYIEITPCKDGKEGRVFNVEVTTPGRRHAFKTRALSAAQNRATEIVGASIGKACRLLDFVHAYSDVPTGGDLLIAHARFESATRTVRLHRSNVCLAYFDGHFAKVFEGDGANKAYRAIVRRAIGESPVHERGRGFRSDLGNDPVRLAWLISEYIGANARASYPHDEPRLIGAPTFLQDLDPDVYHTIIK